MYLSLLDISFPGGQPPGYPGELVGVNQFGAKPFARVNEALCIFCKECYTHGICCALVSGVHCTLRWQSVAVARPGHGSFPASFYSSFLSKLVLQLTVQLFYPLAYLVILRCIRFSIGCSYFSFRYRAISTSFPFSN